MTRGRLAVAAIVSAGLALAAWSARPAELGSLLGWLFAIAWVSAAWTLLLAASVAWVPLGATVGALVTLAGSELLFHGASSDALLLAVKPIYQVPIALVGGAIGHGLVRLGAHA